MSDKNAEKHLPDLDDRHPNDKAIRNIADAFHEFSGILAVSAFDICRRNHADEWDRISEEDRRNLLCLQVGEYLRQMIHPAYAGRPIGDAIVSNIATAALDMDTALRHPDGEDEDD